MEMLSEPMNFRMSEPTYVLPTVACVCSERGAHVAKGFDIRWLYNLEQELSEDRSALDSI